MVFVLVTSRHDSMIHASTIERIAKLFLEHRSVKIDSNATTCGNFLFGQLLHDSRLTSPAWCRRDYRADPSKPSFPYSFLRSILVRPVSVAHLCP
jgi:hypothetical protein